MYSRPLPRLDNILWLTQLARPFPTTADHIIKAAKKWRFSKSTVDFLGLFPHDTKFEDGEEFFARSQDLQLLIRQERDAPIEHLKSPQD